MLIKYIFQSPYTPTYQNLAYGHTATNATPSGQSSPQEQTFNQPVFENPQWALQNQGLPGMAKNIKI